jgi:hypothetical protein
VCVFVVLLSSVVRGSTSFKRNKMPPTFTEKQIRHARRRKGVLVPLLEDFMRKPVNIETEEDVQFLTGLFRTMADREDRRRDPDTNVFSPSALAQCLRQVYLKKHHAQLEIPARLPPRIEPNFYFLNGNFLHVKWQFALYKMELAISDPKVFHVHRIEREFEWGFEVPILSKRSDHGGTVDGIVLVFGEPFILDAKGLNVRTWGEITRDYVPVDYSIQLTDYMILWNSQKGVPFRIEKALLLAENKGGPDNKHPLALHEKVIDLADFKPEVRRRLEVLREHEAKEKIPKPECTSTFGFQFGGCPFAGFCKKEVTEIQRRHRERESRKPSTLAVARPTGRKRKRRVAKT